MAQNTKMNTVRVAVVGAGVMGRNHARVYSEMPEVELVAVADSVPDVARRVTLRSGGTAYTDFVAMLDQAKPQAITIATPTSQHLAVAREAMLRGIHVLVEKPIALSVAAAQEMIDLAQATGTLLTVGHIERFNPAVIALKAHIANGELGRLFQIDARRQSPFPARIRDVGVVVDLAVHDLDILRYVSGDEVIRVYAETNHHLHDTCEDSVSGLLRMSSGAIATVSINWLTPTKVRELCVTGEYGMYKVDYLTQDLYFFENGVTRTPDWDALKMLRGISEGAMIRHAIVKKEPLRAELETFVGAVLGEGPVQVTGHDGLVALQLALLMLESSEMQLALTFRAMRDPDHNRAAYRRDRVREMIERGNAPSES
jgi:predicted dehydrogenase